jgi:hypothetical protein
MDAKMTDAVPTSNATGDISDLLPTPYTDAFAFSDRENQILQLHDQLLDIEMQQSLFEAQRAGNVIVHVLPKLF